MNCIAVFSIVKYNVFKGVFIMLGEKIRNLRKENKISQEALAEKLGVSRQSISLWENDQTMPSMENIVSIANIFGVSTDTLLKENTEKETEEKIEETIEIKKPLKKKSFMILSIILVLAIIIVSAFVVVDKFSNRKLSAEEIFDMIAPSTVEINAIGDTFESTGTGSFIDNEGTVVTNYHVIESCHTINIKAQNGNTYKVQSVLGFDKDRDLAIIKTDCQNERFIEFESDKAKTGEKVYTLGSSLGLTGTFSEGIISSASRKIEGLEFIQTTAPISSGNSGGPLVNEYGKVIGITTGAFTEGQNLNLAIPASAINEISRERTYSINDFFQLSQGKVVDKEEKTEEKPIEEENYTPVDIGYFDSLKDLEEAAQRNPDAFKLPVIASIQGTIVRTTNNKIFLVHAEGVANRHRLYLIRAEQGKLNEDEAKEFGNHCLVNMIDDTTNRVLSGDVVIIKGIYRHSAKTISNCTYELIE